MSKNIIVRLGADVSGVTSGMKQAQSAVVDGTSSMTSGFGGAEKGVFGLNSEMLKTAGGVLIAKTVAKAFDVIKDSVSGAVDRVDILNKYPKVLEQMGVSGEVAQKSMDKLKDGVMGLPTSLQEVTGHAQQFFVIMGDAEKSTDLVIALNNAFLASGASQEEANRGMEAYRKMLASGQVDMQRWTTLQETMPYALKATAEAMGFTGETAVDDLYSALQSGEITMDEFNDMMIQMSEETGGFADQAQTASGGIKTAFINMKNAVVTGIADIIQSYDEWAEANGFWTIEESIKQFRKVIDKSFELVRKAFTKTLDVIKETVKAINESVVFNTVKDAIKELVQYLTELWDKFKESEMLKNIKKDFDDFANSPLGEFLKNLSEHWGEVAGAIAIAIGAFLAVKGVVGAVTGIFKGVGLAVKGVGLVFTALTSPTGIIILAMAALIGIGVAVYKNWDKIKEFFSTIWDGIKEYFTETWTAIKDFFTETWESIKETISNILEGINETITGIWDGIKEFFIGILDAIKEVITNAWDSINNSTSTAWELVKTYIINPIKNVYERIRDIIQGVIDFLEFAWNLIKLGSEFGWDGIKLAIKIIVRMIADYIRDIFNNIKDFIKRIWDKIKETSDTLWNGIFNIISNIVNGIKDKVSNTFTGLKDKVSGIWDSIKSTASSKWEAIKGAITKPIHKARDAVKEAIDKMKGYFDFSWSLPKLKVPHLSISGGFSLKPPSVPKFSVDWYKTGGIATGASIVGIGEAGDEAIVPLSDKSRMKPFAEAVANMIGVGHDNTKTKETIITGNTFVVREEADIKRVAEELHRLEAREERLQGRRAFL